MEERENDESRPGRGTERRAIRYIYVCMMYLSSTEWLEKHGMGRWSGPVGAHACWFRLDLDILVSGAGARERDDGVRQVAERSNGKCETEACSARRSGPREASGGMFNLMINFADDVCHYFDFSASLILGFTCCWELCNAGAMKKMKMAASTLSCPLHLG
jgi:hypothetical protein